MLTWPSATAPAQVLLELASHCIACPLCAEEFQRDPESQRPISVSCGHTLCQECVQALLLMPEPKCAVCSVPITQDTVFNVGLVEFSEVLANKESMNACEERVESLVSKGAAGFSPSSGTLSPLPTSSKRSRLAYDDGSRDAVAHVFVDESDAATELELAAQRLHSKLAAIEAMKKRLQAQTDCNLARFYEVIDSVQSELARVKHNVTRAVSEAKAGYEKVLDAEKDAVEVSCGQLRAVAALCSYVSGKRERSSREALTSADQAFKLLTSIDKPVPSAYVSIECDPTDALSAIDGLAHVVDLDVDGHRSSYSLAPNGFLRHGLKNYVKIQCLNGRSEPFTHFTLDDVTVDVHGVEADGSRPNLYPVTSIPSPGCVSVEYTVESPAVVAVEARVSIRGVMIGGNPIRISPMPGCAVRGTYLKTLPITTSRSNIGLLVNKAGTEMFVSNENEHTIAVYDLTKDDVPLLRELGRSSSYDTRDATRRQFGCPSRLAWSKCDTILVAEYSNRRLQEITVEGTFIKFFEVADYVFAIAAREDLVCVVLHAHSHEDNRVKLYDYNTAALLRSFAGYGEELGCLKNAAGVRFSLDGSQIVVAEGDRRRLMVFETSTGRFIKAVGEGEFGSAADVEFGADNKLIGLNCYGHCLLVYDGESSSLLSTIGRQGYGASEFQYPTSLAVWNHLLYVLDNNTARVQVFE
jgi:hypothetical protein